jgi:putative AdoMet-dependent methyltransferase
MREFEVGREFDKLFDEWSHSYDETVNGNDHEYEDVFEDYDIILSKVAEKAGGTVVEFGVGTGNLTQKLLEKGLKVIGIEPNEKMRSIAGAKLPGVIIIDGDFQDFNVDIPVQTFVSTYAFHHLTDEEKEIAIEKYSRILPENGRIVFADTIFETEEAKQQMIKDSQEKGFTRLAEDLQREYYTTIAVLQNILIEKGFTVSFTKLNRFVWLLDAVKEGRA